MGRVSRRRSKLITVLPENRSLTFSSPNPEVQINDPVTVTALNFRGPQSPLEFSTTEALCFGAGRHDPRLYNSPAIT